MNCRGQPFMTSLQEKSHTSLLVMNVDPMGWGESTYILILHGMAVIGLDKVLLWASTVYPDCLPVFFHEFHTVLSSFEGQEKWSKKKSLLHTNSLQMRNRDWSETITLILPLFRTTHMREKSLNSTLSSVNTVEDKMNTHTRMLHHIIDKLLDKRLGQIEECLQTSERGLLVQEEQLLQCGRWLFSSLSFCQWF